MSTPDYSSEFLAGFNAGRKDIAETVLKARADERATVIKEIEGLIPDYKHDDLDGGESIGLNELQTILNQLKND